MLEDNSVLFKGIKLSPVTNDIKYPMLSIQSKITRHPKKQETITHNHEKNHLARTEADITEVIKLVDEDVKISGK